jgi:hypothetical protein
VNVLAREVEGQVVRGMGRFTGVEHRDGYGRYWSRSRFAFLSERAWVERAVDGFDSESER